MTTGEKLSKLRKENGYTQEALAEILGVSRQSISKWESDGAFPETEKLIQLSRLYQCTIDYLLKNEVEENKNTSKEKSEFQNQVIKHLFTGIWSVVIFVITLLFYLFPYMRLNVISGNVYIICNIYDLLSSATFSDVNILIMISLILQIIMFISGIVIVFYNKKIFYLIRMISSMIEVFIWLDLLSICIDGFQIGMVFLIISSLGNMLGLLLIKNNKYSGEKNKEINNCRYTMIWSLSIAIISMIIYFLPYSDFYIIYPNKETYLDLSVYGMFMIIDHVLIELLLLLSSLGLKIVMMLLSVLIYKNNKKSYYFIRNILSIIDLVLLPLIFMCQYFNGDMGYYLLMIFTVINSFGLLIDKNNKYYKGE